MLVGTVDSKITSSIDLLEPVRRRLGMRERGLL